ncbi:hypothetical protein [Sulfitobacter sp. PS-8MA]|uniref:hypothetical protein n=1 Tax=Sulfitobacter sp. PS-8MA TaxID=3237707 RepID=UPI0034C6B420
MANDDLNTEIVLRAGEHEAKLPAIAQPILQALHNSLIGVEESYKTRIHFPSICCAEDIEQLIDLLSQWISTYGPLSQAAKVTCIVNARDKMKGSKRHSFKSLESFLKSYPGITDPTSTVVVSFSAVLKLPDQKVLDKVNMEVELKATMPYGYIADDADDDDELDWDLNADMRYPSEYYNLHATVRYTNYLVAKGLLDVVEGWFQGLPEAQRPKKRPKFIRELLQDSFFESFPVNKTLIRVVSILLPAIALFGSNSMLTGFLGNNSESVPANILIFICLWALFYTGFSLLFRALTQVSGLRSRHLLLNAGDKRAMERYETKREKHTSKRRLLTNTIFYGFIVSVVASVFVGFIGWS